VSETSEPLPVEEFIQALRAHAAAVEHAETSPEAVESAADLLRAAALGYDEAVFHRSGMAAIFDDLSDYDDEDWEDEGLDLEELARPHETTGAETGVERITLAGRWDFLVRDAAALRQLAEDHLLADVPDIDDETLREHTDTPQAAMDTLIGHGDPLHWPGLEAAGAQWTIGRVEKTLFEMTDDEREQTY
jgi:hypothetical protein